MENTNETANKALDALVHVTDNFALSENQKGKEIAEKQLKSLTTVSIITIAAVVVVVLVVAFVTVSLLKKDKPHIPKAGIEQTKENNQQSTGGDNNANGDNVITF